MSTHDTQSTTEKAANYLKRRRVKQYTKSTPFSQHSNQGYSSSKNDHRVATSTNKHQLCRRCGTKHEARKCPAYGATCYMCNGRNHYSAVCESKSMSAVTTPHGHDEDSSEEEFFIHSVVKCVESTRCIVFMVLVNVCNSRIKMKVDIKMKEDTGAETNAVPMKTWKHIREKPNLTCSSVVLKTLGGGVVERDGVAEGTYQVGDKCITTELCVTREKCVLILGLDVSVAVGLVQPGDNVVTNPHTKMEFDVS